MTGADRHTLSPALLHDLRTPLGQIIGYAELLAERAEEAGDERFAPDLKKISAAGYRMLALIEDIFTATRGDVPGGFTWEDVDTLRGLADGSRSLKSDDAERLASVSTSLAALLPARG
jgi:signal transduction histidine kinase